MKITQVIHNYYPAKGGPRYTLKHLSEKLVENYGDEVRVLTSDSFYGPEINVYKQIEPQKEIIRGVTIERFKFTRWHYSTIDLLSRIYKRIYKTPLPHSILKKRWGMDSRALDISIAKSKADVIMASTINYNFCDYPLWRMKTPSPKPFVIYGSLHLHINWSQHSPVIQRALNCDCYIANTEYEKKRLINQYGLDESKVVTIGTGIEPGDYSCIPAWVTSFKLKYRISDDQKIIGYIGRLSEGKGTGVLFDAFEKIATQFSNAVLVIAGSKTNYSATAKLKYKNNPKVIVIEDFDDTEKRVLFNAIDIFVLPSKGESFGVVFLEAWSCSKPVIGAYSHAVNCIIQNGVDGLLFMPDNADDLAQKITLLLDSDNLCTRMGKAGYQKISTKFSWDTIVQQYREAYELGIEHFMRHMKDKKY